MRVGKGSFGASPNADWIHDDNNQARGGMCKIDKDIARRASIHATRIVLQTIEIKLITSVALPR